MIVLNLGVFVLVIAVAFATGWLIGRKKYKDARWYYLNSEDVKNQLLSRVDEIVKAIMDDKTLEIRRDRNCNIQLFEVKKKIVK